MSQELYEALGEIVQDERGKRLEMFNRDQMVDAIRRFPVGTVALRLMVERDKFSNRQRRFWRGVVVPLFAEHCGYEVQEMHEVLMLKLNPMEITDMDTGEIRIVPGHTSDLDTKKGADLIERAQRLGAEMGIYIPDPGEVVAERGAA